jgi:hypothetical protein
VTAATVFLLDVDDTLLDNDRVTDDLRRHLLEMHLVRVREAEPLQRAQVVGAAELASQLLEELPRALFALLADVFARQGRYATDPEIGAAHPPADVSVDRIGDLLELDLESLVGSR